VHSSRLPSPRCEEGATRARARGSSMQAAGLALSLYPTFCGVYFTVRRHSGSGSARQPTRRGARSTDMCFSFSFATMLRVLAHISAAPGPYSHTIGHISEIISRQPNL